MEYHVFMVMFRDSKPWVTKVLQYLQFNHTKDPGCVLVSKVLSRPSFCMKKREEIAIEHNPGSSFISFKMYLAKQSLSETCELDTSLCMQSVGGLLHDIGGFLGC